jgi:LAO/AO transport system kinase
VHLLRPKFRAWSTRVLTCSALQRTGVSDVWEAVEEFHAEVTRTGELRDQRGRQATAWMWNEVRESLLDELRDDAAVQELLADIEDQVRAGQLTPTVAARQLLEAFDRR